MFASAPAFNNAATTAALPLTAASDSGVGGSQLVALRCAEALGGRVVLGAPARAVSYTPDAVTVAPDCVVLALTGAPARMSV